MILILDNYDSFTYNLWQMVMSVHGAVEAVRNDEISVEEVARLDVHGVIISPGPGCPADAGISVDLVRKLGAHIPILGVCLGHQAIGSAFGATIGRAPGIVHGKTSDIHHDGCGVLRGLPNPFKAGRYHSLVVKEEQFPTCLEVGARSACGQIMAMRHRCHPIHGVQFHPESIMTPCGRSVVENFVELCMERRQALPPRNTVAPVGGPARFSQASSGDI